MENRILIVGDSCVDLYTYCKTSRLAPDKPVPVLEIVDNTKVPGMAYNVFSNATSISNAPQLIDLITNPNWESVIKNRFVDQASNHMFMRVDSSIPIHRIRSVTTDYEYETVVLSDYDKGFLTTEDIQSICESHPRVFLDTKKVLGPWASSAKFIKINNHEYERSKDFIDDSMRDKIIQTMGSSGCLYKGETYPVDKVDVMDVSGAGDTFMAALAVHYTDTEEIESSIKFANECASKVVRKKGTSVL